MDPAARPWVTALVVALCACGPPTRSTTTATVTTPGAAAKPTPKLAPDVLRVLDPALEVVARTPTFDAIASDGRVFALDPAVASLRAHDLATGKELWKTPLGVEPYGLVRMFPSYGKAKRVLVHIQNTLLLFDPTSGARTSQTGPWSNDRGWLSTDRGVCMFASDCDQHLIDCEDAHPYGPVLRSAVTHLYHDLGKPHDNVCWGPQHLVGRGGNVVVAVTDGRTFEVPDQPLAEGPITVGIDATTGKTVWTRRGLGCRYCATSGVSSDGATCWIASSDGELEVFACATGKAQLKKKFSEKELASTSPALFSTWASHALFVSTATDASALDPKSGKVVWSTPLPKAGLGLPLGTPIELARYSTWGARTVLLLDPKSGKEVARFALPAYTELEQSPDLGLRVRGGVAFDAKGQARTLPADKPLFTLERDKTPRTLLSASGKVLADVTTDLTIVATEHTSQGDRLALYVYGPKGATGELIFARWAP